jgi:hypothetical protein
MKNKLFLALPILFIGFVACNKKVDPTNDPNNTSESFIIQRSKNHGIK